MSVRSLVEEPFRIHGMGNCAERKKWVDDLLETVDLSVSSKEIYSFEFSVGHRMSHPRYEETIKMDLSLREIAPGHWVAADPTCLEPEDWKTLRG